MSILDQMLRDLPFSSRELQLLIATAPQRYKIHFIEKRHNRGRRQIAQPTAEIKLLQRWLVANVIDSLPVHHAATAYVKGKSIAQHARLHANSRYLLKLDFENFFPSIRSVDFVRHVRQYSDLTHEESEMITRILFFKNPDHSDLRLSIGAPSSPVVSNTLMFDFDERVSQYCAAREIQYSRYADDLALSTNIPHILDKALGFVKTSCKQLIYPKLALNDDKTVFTSKKFSRQLTGIVLASDGSVSLGRLKKRTIRAMAHRASLGQLNVEETDKLRGLIAFAYSVEPAFVRSLRRMVGEEKMRFLFPTKENY